MPAFRSTSGTIYLGGTGALVIPPGTIADGDVLIASVYASGGLATCTPPGGWTQHLSYSYPTAMNFFLFSKKASGESGSYTFTVGNNGEATGVVNAYRNAVAVDVVGAGNHSTSANPIALSLTPTVPGCLLLYQGCNNTGTSYSALTGGLTELNQGTGQIVAGLDVSGTGPTGNFQSTISSALWIAVLVAISGPPQPSFREISRRPAPFRPGLAR